MRDTVKAAAATGAGAVMAMVALGRRRRNLAESRDILAGVERERTLSARAQVRQRELERELDAIRSRISDLESDNTRLAQRSAIPAMITRYVPADAVVLLIAAGKGDPFSIADHDQIWLCDPVDEDQPTDDELVERLEAHLEAGLVHAIVPATSAAWLGRHPRLDRYVRDNALLIETDDIGCALLEFPSPS